MVRPAGDEISRQGTTRHLRRQLMDLLVLLAGRAGQVVSRDEILQAIWGTRFVAGSVLPRCISELRELLGDDPEFPTFVETIPKRGYRLIAPVVDSSEGPLKTRQPSVLVLPFRDLSATQDQQYFCDGLSEQIINSLTRLPGLRVIARTSAFQFRGDRPDLPRIMSHLHAEKILEGSVQKADGQFRITVRLIDTDTGSYVWSQSYEGTTRNVFDLQDEITLRVVAELRVGLLDRERDGLARRHTDNERAHDWYLKGLYHWNQRTREGIIHSRLCFEEALREDPAYALPYVALANSHNIAGFYGMAPPERCYPEARRLVGRALEMDPDLAEAHAALGFMAFLYDWDWPAGQACFKRALVLSPSYSTTYVWYALCLSWEGQPEEAAVTLERAYLSDPLSPLVATTRGVLLFEQEEFQAAQHQLRQVLQVEQNYPLAHLHLGRALAAAGEFDQAAAHAKSAMVLGPSCGGALLVLACARAGRTTEARTVLGELLEKYQTDYVSPVMLAYAHFGLGELDNARRWLAEALERRDPLLPQLRRDPLVREVGSALELPDLRAALA